MAFDSFSAFIAMEGHGPYVWTCYGVFFVLMVGLMAWSRRRRSATMAACRRNYERQERGQQRAARPAATFTRVEVSQD
ncbi:heme exporter protein CcmD [Marinobacter pelagius]|uniref:heme exporter protein CcmD n=1 Tax=Marinobacter sp. C7 TaxID=2951363 RepID=UPI001EEFB7DC|nr:heme exporter protein CcmD [Marinobacter sp. C7]MCG7199207.1 heme exporter protein CcmD [Marinobacter sp. C7]